MSLYPYADRFGVVRGMPDAGRNRAEVLAEVAAMAAAEDAQGFDGRMSGSLYSGDHDHYSFLNEVFAHYSHANVLQRDVYPSATRFEGELIAMVADVLHGGPLHPGATDVCGVVTSGGTESLMNPLLVYREWGRQRGITSPNVVMPSSAHPALDKAAHYFGIELRKARLADDVTVDVDHLASLIDVDTVALVGTAGTYPHGAIDPIAALSDLALARGVNLHVDGCLGGLILCWGEDVGVDVPVFDFRLPGVTSISADTHKYGYGLKGTSVLLYRSPELRRLQYFMVPDWSGGLYTSPGMSGSRSGGVIAAAWAAMVSLGRHGYRAIAADIFAAAARIRESVEAIPELRVIGDPLFNVAFAADGDVDVPVDIFHVNDSLTAQGWRLNGLQSPPALHFCVTRPNTLPGVTERFDAALHQAVGYARERVGSAPRSGAAYGGGVPAEMVTAGMAGWLDATQSVPPPA
jgi:glutamate/tyrosine decarboxylase-like PLP-dependent enzyme